MTRRAQERCSTQLDSRQWQREELARLAGIYSGRIVDVTESSYIVEMTGDSDKLDAFIDTIGAKRILEVVRSGVLGILRGTKALRA